MEHTRPVCTLVVNPTAGHGRAGRQLPEVVTALAAASPHHRLEVHQTTSYDEARARCAEAVRRAVRGPESGARRPDCLVVMGGDGMMHLGLNACAGSDVPLGMVPAGTGNDLCRGLGILARGPHEGIAHVAAGHTRQVDLIRIRPVAAAAPGQAEDVWVGSVVASGFDAAVNRRANAMSWPRGALRYALAGVVEIGRFAPVEYDLVLDGEPRRVPAMLVAVGNGGFYGGGMSICPDADPADGVLDLTIVHPVSRPHLLAMLPLMFSRAFTRHPAVEQARARRVELRRRDAATAGELAVMGDGEPLASTPLLLEVVPRALTVFAPPVDTRPRPLPAPAS